jgi:DNA-binding transcriptional regulator YiaG
MLHFFRPAFRFQKGDSVASQLAKIASGQPTNQLQEAMTSAMGPSNAIRAAIDTMPSSAVQKAIQRVSKISAPKMDSLPTVSRTPPHMMAQEKRSDLHALRNVAELGEAIRRTRKSEGLTQQSFADLAGVGRRFVSELEQGKQTLEIG